MAQKITNKTTDLFVGTILKVINIKENTPFILNKFYKITDGDGVGALFVGGYSDVELTMHELGNYFEHVSTLDDIVDLESKALLIKQIFNQFKELSEDAEEEKSKESLIDETIAFLAQDEVYKCDEIELRFICNNMDITMIEQCSCCGVVIMPDDECYSDELNDNDAALCDHCSIYNEETAMYQKAVQQDVIEKLTGYKFSPHLGNVGSKIEEFNFWLNLHEHKFGFKEPNNNDIFFNFMEEYTEWNFCDCCLMIEKSDDLTWTDGQFFDDEKDAINFVNASYSNFAAICQNCLNKFISRTKLSLHEIVQRIKENKMIFRIGDFVILKNKDLILNNMFGYIESLDETTQTYKLKEFDNVVIKEEDLFDVANEAYIIEYNKFIENNHVEKVDDLSDFANDNKEHTIDMLVENFGFKDEFIKHLKANDLPYERFVVKSEVTIKELDETLVVKNELLEYIFCQDDDNGIVIPTYKELTEVDEYQSNWKLSEEYGDYSLSTLVYLVNEESSKFFNIQKVLNGHKEKFRKSKKYGFRETVEFGAPIEIIKVLQNLHEIDSEKELDGTEMVFLQANISTQDYSTIEVVLQCDINEKELLDYLKSNVEKEHHDEVDKLLEAIKEAKADKHDSLHVYDC